MTRNLWLLAFFSALALGGVPAQEASARLRVMQADGQISPAFPQAQEGEAEKPAAAEPEAIEAEIGTDPEKLPFPVRQMRQLLMEAARSGDIERLRPYIGEGDDMTQLSFGGLGGDPIEFLRSISGDNQGHEILAILLEVLEAGYAHAEPGTEHEMYVWPYFHALRLDRLTPQQRVELFKLLTFGDYEEMLSFGAYIFYRVGITPAGRWRFFVAGD